MLYSVQPLFGVFFIITGANAFRCGAQFLIFGERPLYSLLPCSVITSFCSVLHFIIWQDSLEVNPSVLIGYFLVGILPYGNGHMLCIFCSRKLANSNYEKKTIKYSHLRKKLPKKIAILQSLQ